jgi:hypothetical protein
MQSPKFVVLISVLGGGAKRKSVDDRRAVPVKVVPGALGKFPQATPTLAFIEKE